MKFKPKPDYGKANWLQRNMTHRNRYNRWLGQQEAKKTFEAQVSELNSQNKGLGSALAAEKGRSGALEAKVTELGSALVTETDRSNEMGAMFAIVAHDLRSPFNGVLGFLEFILSNFDSTSDDEKKQYLDNVYCQANRIYDMQAESLGLANYFMGKQDVPMGKVSIKDIAANVIYKHKGAAFAKGLRLESAVLPGLDAHGNSAFVDIIVSNLVSNAIKFTATGSITISAKGAQGGKVEITVSDTGVGMPDHIFSQLFMPEGKIGRKGTGGEKSTGLGLLMVASMVRRNGGRIWAESEEGKGSRFHVELPAAQD